MELTHPLALWCPRGVAQSAKAESLAFGRTPMRSGTLRENRDHLFFVSFYFITTAYEASEEDECLCRLFYGDSLPPGPWSWGWGAGDEWVMVQLGQGLSLLI